MKRYYPPGFDSKNIWHWLAVGLGSGLAPKAPGTCGSLAAVLCFIGLQHLSLLYFVIWLLCSFVVGLYAATVAGKSFGVHDHGSIVIDEFVGQWLSLFPLVVYGQHSPWFWGVAFGAFRGFDILKPWPVGWLDRQVKGGLGVMLDDVAAGVMGAVVVWVLVRFF